MRGSAKYKVKENVEIKPNGLGGRGIEIAEHANVTLNIEEGKTLTVTGRRSMDHRPGRAAIYLPQDSKLTVEGNGTLIAKGGDASPGEAGGKAQDSYVAIGEYLSVGHGGHGGLGGFGAGAGIGTDGGAGGAGGAGGKLFDIQGEDSGARHNWYGYEGEPGKAGSPAEPAGTLDIKAGTVLAEGGAGAAGGAGGGRGKYGEQRCGTYGTAACTSGGGGGTAGNGIGAGGTGGGGGGGASANIDGLVHAQDRGFGSARSCGRHSRRRPARGMRPGSRAAPRLVGFRRF